MSVTETERPEVFWVDATSKHVVAAMHGKDVEARFRDAITQDWTSVRKLKGWSKSGFDDVFYDGSSAWIFCQVYEPQSWWLERPDPGPGYVLLKKFPDEELKPGDEYFDRPTGRWHLPGHAITQDQQPEEIWYRRRMEPVEPEPKHYVLRVGDSCETPCGNRTVVTPQGRTQRFLNVKAGDTIKTIHGQTITITEKGFEVC